MELRANMDVKGEKTLFSIRELIKEKNLESLFIYARNPEKPWEEKKIAEYIKPPNNKDPYLFIRFSDMHFKTLNWDIGMHLDLLLTPEIEFKEIFFARDSQIRHIPRDWFLRNAKIPKYTTWDTFAYIHMPRILAKEWEREDKAVTTG